MKEIQQPSVGTRSSWSRVLTMTLPKSRGTELWSDEHRAGWRTLVPLCMSDHDVATAANMHLSSAEDI